MINELADLVREKRVILFAGAGVSMGLGLPSWRQLIDHMAQELNYDPDLLASPNANYLTIAEFYELQKGIGPLRSWMDRAWSIDDDKIRGSDIHQRIIDLGFPFIYTTNYDRIIERAFELRGIKFAKIVSATDIAKASPTVPHVVKFHGDFDSDDSIVLSESKYFDRLRFEHPLDIKFRADALGRSILFVGYSLTDINMRLLLYRLRQTWKEFDDLHQRPKSFVFMTRPDSVQQHVLQSWGVEAIVADVDDVSQALPSLFDELVTLVGP
jgi:hypothetical protein